MRFKSGLGVVSLYCCSLLFNPAWAKVFIQPPVDLLQVYQEALQHDPVFQKAEADKLATQEAYPQAKAALLPALNFKSTATRERLISQNSSTAVKTSQTSNLMDNQLNLNQTLIDAGSWSRVSQAEAIVNQAEAYYRLASQDLMLRVANAYLDILAATDNLRVTLAERQANERQLAQAKQRYEVGVDTITSVHEAQAAYDGVTAQVISGQNQVKNALESLRQITTIYHDHLAPLRGSISLKLPYPQNMEAWTKIAVQHNYQLLAARYGVQIAKQGVSVAQSGHLPTLDLVASYDVNKNGNINGNNIDNTHVSAVGMQLNVPILEGGLVLSQVREARYNYRSALDANESVYQQVLAQTRQAYNNLLSSIDIVKADRQAVISAQSSLNSTEAAYKVGTRTIVDVLNAEQNLYAAQRGLAAAQYVYVKQILNLKQISGLLNVRDLQQVNDWLMSNRTKQVMSK